MLILKKELLAVHGEDDLTKRTFELADVVHGVIPLLSVVALLVDQAFDDAPGAIELPENEDDFLIQALEAANWAAKAADPWFYHIKDALTLRAIRILIETQSDVGVSGSFADDEGMGLIYFTSPRIGQLSVHTFITKADFCSFFFCAEENAPDLDPSTEWSGVFRQEFGGNLLFSSAFRQEFLAA